MMAKGFVTFAISHQIAGLEDVIDWLYKNTKGGPNLLQKIIEDSRVLLETEHTGPNSSLASSNSEQQGGSVTVANGTVRLSSGARMLLRKHLDAMEKHSHMRE